MSQFAFRGSPAPTQVAVSGSPPPPPAPAPASAAPVSATAPPSPPSAARCCDTGRPLYTDPLTGQSVCSCQYELLDYQRRAASSLPLSMYSIPYTPDGIAAYLPAIGADQAPFYSPTAENLTGAGWPYPSVYHPYDAAFAGYPFNGYGMDINGARRKNATRETTSMLKAWLNEHKKNPYPTKGEKIMLAIVTKMTLTQVSTWFANARRRLKKENKMTWEPRNRVEDEDNNNDEDSGRKSADHGKDPDSKDSGTGSSEDGDRPRSDWGGSRPESPECLPPHLLYARPPPQPPAGPSKPRIWSLADMASKDSDPSPPPRLVSAAAAAAAAHASVVPPPAAASAAAAAAYYSGKLVSPLAPPRHHLLYAARPHPDLYRGFYAAHHDAYSRLSKVPAATASSMTVAPAPASSSSSSSSSVAEQVDKN